MAADYEDVSKKEEEILQTIRKLLPMLTDTEKERLLAFGEGIAFKSEMMGKKGA